MKKIVVAGHVCLDITPTFPSESNRDIKELMVPGKLIYVNEPDIFTGGAVANTGLSMKLLGADVKLMGRIGNDEFGKIVIEILNRYDAGDGMIVSEDTNTSYSIILAPPGNDRVFLHNPGANDTFTSKDLLTGDFEDVCLFHFGYPVVMKNMYINDGEQLVEIFRAMKEKGIATSLDMAAIDPTSEAGYANWYRILSRVLPYVDFFVPSIEEMGYMLDRGVYDQWQKRADGKDVTTILSIAEDVAPLAQKILDMGAKVVLLKCGVPGIYYKCGNRNALQQIGKNLDFDIKSWEGKEGFEKSFKPDRIYSATGAGDTSIAAFLVALVNGYPVERCLQYATAAGACCVTGYDALSGLKTFEEIDRKIELGWEKQE